MGRSFTLHKAEVRIELVTECDGETPFGAQLFKFGEPIEYYGGPEVGAKIIEWVENHAP
jgi:hypothetical protein